MAQSFHHSDDVASLLRRVELLVWTAHMACGHLPTVESCDCVMVREEGHYAVILSALAVATWNEDEEGTGAERPVVQRAVFVFNGGVGGCGRHLEMRRGQL